MLGANGIVGAGAPIAVGAGFANKYKDNGNVAAAFFGDGSTNIGAFHEAAKLPGFLHLYVGQEAVASGVCAALTDSDQITSTHRGHGHLVAKGGRFDKMMAELMGKSTGYCKGKGGSMHISSLDVGMLGANGIVGAGAPIAVGAGFANKYRGDGNIAATFFGDGSTNIGAFHEAANMAAALQLPVVFVCENNEYGEFTPRDKTMAITDIVDRAAGYGFPGVIVDGMDVVAVHEAATAAVDRARRGDGPSLIEAKTYRFYNHHGIHNLGLKYRTDDEVARWRERDPIFTFEERLIEAGTTDRDGIDVVWAELRADIAAAIEFAESSPSPDADQLLVDVYSETGGAPS
jgi:TPP-dependent pyruvate/acetoin dehydrogenase alpha subunit